MKIDIFILFFFYYISIFSILGYGISLQRLINISENNRICLGYSGLIGIFFLTIYSYISHLFYAHGIYHNLIILILGIFLFYKNILEKKFHNTDFKVLVVIFSLLFFSFLIFKSHDDFPYYHFPFLYI